MVTIDKDVSVSVHNRPAKMPEVGKDYVITHRKLGNGHWQFVRMINVFDYNMDKRIFMFVRFVDNKKEAVYFKLDENSYEWKRHGDEVDPVQLQMTSYWFYEVQHVFPKPS
jgi:hypothetical protein